MMSLEDFTRLIRRTLKKVLGEMVSDGYPGNPDYITSEEIRRIAERLHKKIWR